ncbi:MAG: hypothetical protein NXI12_01310 [Alphaproteobacteria bacterium]|nr:hypothetical protein [Alphaproteobacteria bacterium]
MTSDLDHQVRYSELDCDATIPDHGVSVFRSFADECHQGRFRETLLLESRSTRDWRPWRWSAPRRFVLHRQVGFRDRVRFNKKSRSGYQTAFIVPKDAENIESYFQGLEMHLTTSGPTTLAETTPYRACAGLGLASSLISVVKEHRERTFVIFGHDFEPVYIIRSMAFAT